MVNRRRTSDGEKVTLATSMIIIITLLLKTNNTDMNAKKTVVINHK